MRHAHGSIPTLVIRKASIRGEGIHGSVHAMPWEAAAASALCWGRILVRMVIVVIIIDGRAVLRGLFVTPNAGNWNIGLAGWSNLEVSGGPGPGAGKVVERIYAAGVADCVQA